MPMTNKGAQLRKGDGPTRVGTQDSPVLEGQKPQQVPAPVPSGAGKRGAAVPWWERDWNNVARGVAVSKTRKEVIAEDTGRMPPTVQEMGGSDVVGVNFTTRTLQGVQHRYIVPVREGMPQLQAYIEESHAGFVRPVLPDVALAVTPIYDREAVPRGMTDVPLEAYAGVQTFYR